MRALLIPVLGFALMGANGETEIEPTNPDQSPLVKEYHDALEELKNREALAKLRKSVEGPIALRTAPAACRDRLERAQEAVEGEDPSTPDPLLNIPMFRRQPATPGTPLAIYAVDRRENGCGVMVMMGNPSDVRPLPSLSAEDHRLMPAEGGHED